MRLFQFVLLFLLLVSSGCSLQPGKTNSGKIQIILENAKQDFQKSYTSLTSFFATADGALPTVTSDFDCFFVNVTGPGVPEERRNLGQCHSSDNMHGRGFGKFSGLARRGGTLELDLPAGNDRNIDVFGVFPSVAECGHNSSHGSGAYFLGGTNRSLTESSTVVIPISYSGAAHSMSCGNVESETTYKHFLYAINSATFTIYGFLADPDTGLLTPLATPTYAVGTVFAVNGLTISPNGQFLYAVTSDGETFGYSINQSSGVLTPLNAGNTMTPGGGSRDYRSVKIRPAGDVMYISDFFNSKMEVFPVSASTGAVSGFVSNPTSGTNPILFNFHPSLNLLYVAPIAGPSGIKRFDVDATTGVLSLNDTTDMATNFKSVLIHSYSSGTAAFAATVPGFINQYTVDGAGALTANATSVMTPGPTRTPMRLITHPTNNSYVLASSDNPGCVSVYQINAANAELSEVVATGSPNGTANCEAIVMNPNGNFVYVSDTDPGATGVFAYSFNTTTGAVSLLNSGNPYDTNGNVKDLAIVKIEQ